MGLKDKIMSDDMTQGMGDQDEEKVEEAGTPATADTDESTENE